MLKYLAKKLLPALPPHLHLSLLYAMHFKKLLRLRQPATFSEKIQWRKIHQRDPAMSAWADKARAKELAAERVGEDWIIPTLYAGPTIPPEAERGFPVPFIIKPRHGSGSVIVVREAPDWTSIEAETASWISQPYGAEKVEWAYSLIEPGLIIEPFVGGEESPPDFKFYVFNGVVRFIHVDLDRATRHSRTFYDRDWNRQDFALKYPVGERDVPRPDNLDRMIAGAEAIGAGWDFVRVDLYDLPDNPAFGEVTFYPGAGFEKFTPASVDLTFGNCWAIVT